MVCASYAMVCDTTVMNGCNYFMSHNVRGLENDVKRKEIFHYISRKPYNVIFLQETCYQKYKQQMDGCQAVICILAMEILMQEVLPL